jgi:hypothetical protein
MIKYFDDKEADGSTRYNFLVVEWYKLNITQSWINFFALSLSDPTAISSCARSNNLIQKYHFVKSSIILRLAQKLRWQGSKRHQRILQVPGTKLEFKCPKVLTIQ